MVAIVKNSLCHVGFGAILYLIAAVFTYSKPTWFSFAFGPTLWTWRMFNSPVAYQNFFLMAAACVWIGSVAVRWCGNQFIILCALSVVPLLLLNHWLAIWIALIPLLTRLTNLVIDQIRKKICIKTYAIVGLVLALLGPLSW